MPGALRDIQLFDMTSSMHQPPEELADVDVKTSIDMAFKAPVSANNALSMKKGVT